VSYSATDTSVQDGKPLYLLEFTRGASVTRFNSTAVDIASPVGTYRASHFSVTARTQGKDIFKDNLKITFARADNFARGYILGAIDQVTTVALKRMHVGMPAGEAVIEWKGRIVTAEVKDEKITLNCESVYTSMRRLGLSTQFELTCVHAIYSAGCRANKPAMRVEAQVNVISNVSYTMLGISGYPSGWFNSGMMETETDRRFIVSHVGDVVTLSKPLNVAQGTSVALYPGCNKTTANCIDKFDNIDNYLGFPWMPDQDPFGGMPIARL